MTALEQNAELLRQISYIAEDEQLTAKVLRYVKRLLSSSAKDTNVSKGLDEMCEQIKSVKSGKLKGRPINELFDEL